MTNGDRFGIKSSLTMTHEDSEISSLLKITFPDESMIDTLYCVNWVRLQSSEEEEKHISPEVTLIEMSADALSTEGKIWYILYLKISVFQVATTIIKKYLEFPKT